MDWKNLFKSKKTKIFIMGTGFAALLAFGAHVLGLSEELIKTIFVTVESGAGATILGFGAQDMGKEKARIESSIEDDIEAVIND